MFFSVDFHHKLYNATICSWEGLWAQCRHAEIVWRWRRPFEQKKHYFQMFFICADLYFFFFSAYGPYYGAALWSQQNLIFLMFLICAYFLFQFICIGAALLSKQNMIFQMFFICADFLTSVSLHIVLPFWAKYYFQIVWRWDLPVSDFVKVHKQSIILPFNLIWISDNKQS